MKDASYRIVNHSGPALPVDYLGLVYAKWLRSMRYGNGFLRQINSYAYYTAFRQVITHILAQPDCLVRLAVLDGDMDVVLGLCVTRSHRLDYVYVQKDMRRHGIGTELVPRDITTITHLTKIGQEIRQRKYRDWIFNPFT